MVHQLKVKFLKIHLSKLIQLEGFSGRFVRPLEKPVYL